MESDNAFWRSYQEATPGGRIERRGTFLLRGFSCREERGVAWKKGCFCERGGERFCDSGSRPTAGGEVVQAALRDIFREGGCF